MYCICIHTYIRMFDSPCLHYIYIISPRLDLCQNMWPLSWMETVVLLERKTWNVWKGTCRDSTSSQRWNYFAKFVLWNVPSSHEDVFYIQYVSCFFHTRHYVGVNIWTSKRLQSMPLALRTLSAQKKKLMDLWNWPGRNLPNCWRSGKYWVTFLMMIWWIVKSCTCHRRELLYTITLTT